MLKGLYKSVNTDLLFNEMATISDWNLRINSRSMILNSVTTHLKE
jgi:hypothetical protein